MRERFDRMFRRSRHPFAEVLQAEVDCMEASRPEHARGSGTWALAHSGGGIRSASFAIGVQQALNADGLMGEFDYVSTVSGGGYAGSALVWFVSGAGVDEETAEDAAAALPPPPRWTVKGVLHWLRGGFPPVPEVPHRVVDWDGAFPFGRQSVGSEVKGGARNRVLDFLRHHGRYLTPGSGLTSLSFFGSVFQGTLVSAGLYATMALAAMVGLHRGGFFGSPALGDVPLLDDFVAWNALVGWLETLPNWPALGAALTGVLLVLVGILNSLRTWVSAPGAWRYRWMLVNQIWLGRLWIVFLVMVWLAAAEGVANWILEDVVRGENRWKAALPVLGALAGLGSGYTQFGLQNKPTKAGDDEAPGPMASLRLVLGVFGLFFGVTMGSYLLAAWPSPECLADVRAGAEFVTCPPGSGPLSSWPVFFGLAAVVAVVGLFSNLNLVGPHAVYRSRLMEAFLPDPRAVRDGCWYPATRADVTTLEELGRRCSRPLHLINTNVILTDSPRAKYRGRAGDSFTLTPLFCGSTATGWYRTEVFNRSYFSREGMTLSTAMAISGAALNPDAGVGGMGVTRSAWASLLLTFLNLRLGFWVPHPARKRAIFPPNYVSPGVGGGLFGRGLREDAAFLQLSDGGHFENLGLYELVRRRVETIVLTDGGADPDFAFADLANALERVRVDFGAQIIFREDRPITDVVPGEPGTGWFGVATRGFAVADVWYSESEEWAAHNETRPDRPPDGALFYVKTTLVEGLPADLVGYKKAHPAFPDESTADQFFDEGQFEAYRELGYQLAHRMIHEEHLALRAEERGIRPRPPEGGDGARRLVVEPRL